MSVRLRVVRLMLLAKRRLLLPSCALVCSAWLGCPPVGASAAAPGERAAASADDLDARRHQLDDVGAAAAKAEADRKATEASLNAIRADRARLSAALIDTTARVRAAENRASEAEKRLDLLVGSEDATRVSLASRRTEIAEVLAALERVGRSPLPAILASPDDILAAIRSSMLLGAVVPELRRKAEALASDLEDLHRLHGEIAAERDRLAAEVATLGSERGRLSTLIDARQAAQGKAEGTLDAERRHAADLADQTAGLKDLVARLEGEAETARRADEAARAAEDARRKAAEDEARAVGDRAAAAAHKEGPRLAPAIAFADAKGHLALPVSGTLVKGFGASDSYGGEERGLSLSTRPGAVVSAPADAWVSFAGAYRSYGQLLILDGGDGYYIVLAGMERASVVPGQFVLAGEPVGTMGDGSAKTAAAIALGAAEPVLYVEFRKDGAPIDPSPWWAKAGLEKVRG